MSANELEQQFQELNQNWQNVLQSIRSVGQLLRFMSELKDNCDHFTTKINNKYLSLGRSNNKILEDHYKAKEHLKTLMQQNTRSKDEFEEISRVERQKMEENKKRGEENEKEREKTKQVQTEFEQLINEVLQQSRVVHANLLQQLQNVDQQQGLSPRSIRRFHLFTADETLVGQQCAICLQDINVGRRMRRLTCDGQHSFCPGCCETWFANKNTCPLCRHAFV